MGVTILYKKMYSSYLYWGAQGGRLGHSFPLALYDSSSFRSMLGTPRVIGNSRPDSGHCRQPSITSTWKYKTDWSCPLWLCASALVNYPGKKKSSLIVLLLLSLTTKCQGDWETSVVAKRYIVGYF